MGEEDGRSLTGKAQINSALQGREAHRASVSRTDASPSALEATLASISAEVTAEAMERLSRSAIPKGSKPQDGG